MSGHEAGAEHADVREMPDDRFPPAAEAVDGLNLRLARVRLQAHAVLTSQAGAPGQEGLAAVAGDRRGHAEANPSGGSAVPPADGVLGEAQQAFGRRRVDSLQDRKSTRLN